MAELKKKDVQVRKLGEPSHELRKVKAFEVEGDYSGIIKKLVKRPTGVVAKVEITEIDNPDAQYGIASGFLSYDYTDGDVTDSYIETFGIEKDFKEALGKECVVTVELREVKEHEYPCVTWYQPK